MFLGLTWLRRLAVGGMLCVAACEHDAAGSGGPDAATGAGAGGSETVDAGGKVDGGGADAGSSGTGGQRGTMFVCSEPASATPVQCGDETCEPADDGLYLNTCIVPCCVRFEGRDRCGLRSTAQRSSTECELPAVVDPSCDEVPQFPGCCDLEQHKCGIIGGLRPGCATQSSFVTLPASPKSCGLEDDAGIDNDAG